MKNLISNYYYFINENKINEVKSKIGKVLYWLTTKKGFYGEILMYVNVYGTYDLETPTMATNGRDIMFHPDFVLNQDIKALRLVMAHEILHCIGKHCEKLGGRNPKLWNYATDFAINPILKHDEEFGIGFDWPKENGIPFGLYEERFVGMRAEDIYDIIEDEVKKGIFKYDISDGKHLNIQIDNLLKKNEVPNIEKDLIIKISKELSDNAEEEYPDFNKETEYAEKPPNDGEIGNQVHRNVEEGDLLKTTANDYKSLEKSILNSRTPNWNAIKTKALTRNASSMNSEVKKLLNKILGENPIVDWKKELKTFFDNNLTEKKYVLPNKRFISSGKYMYGTKKSGVSSLKTIVAAVDTSSSISKDQIKTFINEVVYLCKTFKSDKLYIIYCSDNIDDVDILKKGELPDFNKIKSTGSNRDGFIPPFQYVQKNNIDPTVFIYLTDTQAEMPDPNNFGIRKYINKVLWFVCAPTIYTDPPFGKVLFAPISAIKPTI